MRLQAGIPYKISGYLQDGGRVGDYIVFLVGYRRADPRFVTLRHAASDKKFVIILDEGEHLHLAPLPPLEALAMQASGNKTGELSGKS